MNIKAMIYTRGYNVEGQIARCAYYAEIAGYDVVGHINGEGLQTAIGGIDVIIVSDASRISRSAEEYYRIIDMLDEHGVRLEIANKENITDIMSWQTIERIREHMATRQ